MSHAVAYVIPPPEWVREPLLQPGERVASWSGPRPGSWLELAVRWNEPVSAALFSGFSVLPFLSAGVGAAVFRSFLAGLLPGIAFGVASAAAGAWFSSLGDKHGHYVLTDRRLLLFKRGKLAEELDLGLLRRLLAASDAVRPVAAMAHEHILDPSKVHPVVAPAVGVTEMGSALRLLRAFGQLQAPANK